MGWWEDSLVSGIGGPTVEKRAAFVESYTTIRARSAMECGGDLSPLWYVRGARGGPARVPLRHHPRMDHLILPRQHPRQRHEEQRRHITPPKTIARPMAPNKLK